MKTKSIFKGFFGVATLLMICFTFFSPPMAVLLFTLAMITTIAKPKLSLFTVLTPGDLTFNGKEIQSLSEAIFEQAFKNKPLNEIHTLYTGIKAKIQIAFLGKLGLIMRKKVGCEINVEPGGIPMSEKFWDPEKAEGRLSPCWDEMLETFFIWSSNAGLRKEDLTGTEFGDFLQMRWAEALEEAVWRIVWFSDTAAAQAHSSGTLTNGTDEDYFNIINGLWQQLFAIGAANPSQVTAGLASRNGQSTFADQKFTAQDATDQIVSNTLYNMTTDANVLLRDDPSAEILVTQSVADQYARERLKFANIPLAYTRLESGMQFFEVNGVRVIPVQIWDRIIHAYFSDGSAYYLPHRAVFTSKSNLGIGTEEVANLSQIDTFYDKKTKTWNMDSEFNIDAKVIQDSLVQLAY